MTYIETVLWRSLRKIYGKMTGFQKSAVIVEETDPLKASDAIYTLLDSKRPCMICLLYTSPSPRDRQKSRMPSSA